MKTIIYIDGFNLFYGCLKKSPFKWLDLNLLFKNILQPHHEIVAIKYYTANVSPRPGDAGASVRQQLYLDALKAHIPHLTIQHGHFLSSVVNMRRAIPRYNEEFVDVMKSEEKGSDVNLAVHALNDAWLDIYQCAVIVSNDSDLAEALRLIKHQFKKRVILVTPGDPSLRKPSFQLKRWAKAVIHITNDDLAASQLPETISGTTIRKPQDWI